MNHSSSPWKSAWGSRQDIDFLNHGAFGACPLEVLANQQQLRYPLESQPLAFLHRELETLLDHSRAVLIDHVTSLTGIIFPLQRIVKLLQQRGVVVIVDGAHAPGMLPLHVERIGADVYTGNCHKWLCAPKGARFLYVAAQWRERLRVLGISHGANSRRTDRSRLHLEFDWTGTGDPTPWICVADAIDFLQQMPGGINQVMNQYRQLTWQARSHLIEHCQLQATVEDERCVGSIASLILPNVSGLPPAANLTNCGSTR